MTWHTLSSRVDDNTYKELNKFLEDYNKKRNVTVTMNKFIVMCIKACKKKFYNKKACRQ